LFFQKTIFAENLLRTLFRFGATHSTTFSKKRFFDSKANEEASTYGANCFGQYYRYRQFQDDLGIIFTYRFRQEINKTFFTKL
jgi:hypothetical protein